jgi:lipopolysaccharide export system protein LptC
MTNALPEQGANPDHVLMPHQSRWRKVLVLWDRMAIYMPLLMMGALALGTYWLVRNTPAFSAPENVKEVKHEVDYFMQNFTIKTFDEGGKLKSEIYGTEARHFSDTDILEIDQARIRSININGQLTTATANRAYSNGDGSEVQLAGNARVVREASRDAQGEEVARLEFRGEFLHAFLNEERVQSHLPVLLIRGADQFTGNVFTYNNLDQVAVLTGRVRGVLMPKSARPAVSANPAQSR